jgi:hypothetical protein
LAAMLAEHRFRRPVVARVGGRRAVRSGFHPDQRQRRPDDPGVRKAG